MIEIWLQKLKGLEPSSLSHIKKCIANAASSLDTKDQDMAQYILHSEVFQEWLNMPTASLLVVGAATAPDHPISFISFSTAMFALTLGGSTNFAALSVFCWLR